MIQPNFLELESKVRRALEMIDRNPGLRSSVSYGERLRSGLALFRQKNVETDLLYTSWRTLRGQQMKAFRDLRIELDRTRELCDEHAVDGFPTRRIVYTDEQELLEMAGDATAAIRGDIDTWPWIRATIDTIDSRIARAAELKRQEKTLYAEYTVRVKERVTAYDLLLAAFRQYLGDARTDASSLADLDSIQLLVR